MKFHTLIVCRTERRARDLRRVLSTPPTEENPEGTGYFTVPVGGAICGRHFRNILFEPDWLEGMNETEQFVAREWAKDRIHCRVIDKTSSIVRYL